MAKYLDKFGLEKVWKKVKSKIAVFDERTDKLYYMAFKVTSDGYPAMVLTEVSE